MKFAIVEDDTQISNLIEILLKDISPDIDLFDNGWKALDHLSTTKYDLIILDIMLPGVNGLEICKTLRKQGKNTPVLMLTSRSEEEDIVAGLEMGADDYLTKPFSIKELMARVRALLRRSDNAKKELLIEQKAIEIGELYINPEQRSFHKNGILIELTMKEFDLLHIFMENPGRTFSRLDLLERIWGEHFEGLEHTVNSNINRLRMKIENDPSNPEYVMTVWGVGYRFNKIH